MDCTIEPIKEEELSLWLKYRMIVIQEVFDCKDPDLLARLEKANEAYFRHSFQKHDHLGCFVRNKEGQIIGLGGICFSVELPSPDNLSGKCAYLMDIFTLPAYRHQGIARQTVLWLIQKALEAGCDKIYLESSEPARNLYLSLGFEEMQDYYKLNLSRFFKER